MKTIALTQRLSACRDYAETRDALDIQWARMFSRLGFMPLVLPTAYDFKVYFSRLKVDGILLSGGNHLSVFSKDPLSKMRDQFEMKLLDFAVKKRIPVFGICHGMQMLSYYFGSTFRAVPDHVGVKHALRVCGESRWVGELKKLHRVNSFHSFALDRPGRNLLVAARSVDGVPEAVEHQTLRIFGQMWHPERGRVFREAELNLIRLFFK